MSTAVTEGIGGLSLDVSDQTMANIPASARVYDSLRKRIVNLNLPPETTLSRAELSKEYGVSQTPIREAMQRLEHDGLIKTYPQSKTVVTKIDIQKLNETHFLRTALECETVRRLSEAKNADLIGKLRAILRMQEALGTNESEFAMFNDLDESFHQALFSAVGNLGLYYLVRSRSGHLERAQRLDLPRGDKARTIVNAHNNIVDGIESQDPEKAQIAMRAHLTGTVERIDALCLENPGYFLKR